LAAPAIVPAADVSASAAAFARAFAASGHQALREDDSIHRPGTGAADPFEDYPAVLQQIVQHTPGKRAVGAPSL
jgi:hypothetical protein